MGYREIPEDRILEFPATPGFKEWEPFFTDESITHPAKMNLNLLRWILEAYTKSGDMVLDPMAGTGSTIILASLLGRHGVAVELEPRFCDMIRANIERTERQTTLVPKGRMICIQGDARELSKLLSEADLIVTSPPYSESMSKRRKGYTTDPQLSRTRHMGEDSSDENIGNLPHGDIDAVITSPPFGPSTKGGGIFREGYKAPGEKEVSDPGLPERHARPLSDDPMNIDNLEYGESVDSIITSPPYAQGLRHRGQSFEEVREKLLTRGYSEEYIKASWSQPYQCQRWAEEAYGEDERNIGNLPPGDIDVVITSPPYEGSYLGGGDQEARRKKLIDSGHDVKDFFGGRAREATLRHYDEVDAVVTSPPYSEGTGHGGGPASEKLTLEKKLHLTGSEAYSKSLDAVVTSPPYEAGPFDRAGGHGGAYAGGIAERDEKMKPEKISDENIGGLKSENYLQAMLQVYRECWKVLKVQGKLIIVVKNFIRDKKVVRLDLDTIKLCEAAGFRLADRWYFKLPTRSFWRILYKKRFPDVPEVEYEDVLVFYKGVDIPRVKVKEAVSP